MRERRHFIGGTDIAAIIGAHPYKTPFQVWMEKVGEAAPFEGNEATRWGSILEDPIAREFAERHNVVLGPGCFVQHPRIPWAGGNVDRLLIPPNGSAPDSGLEVKTAGIRSAHRWGQEHEGDEAQMPDEYVCQCAWYMAVTDLPRWWLAVLIGGQDYREFSITRDYDLEGNLIEAACRFWREHVETRTPPPIDASEAAGSWLTKRFPREKTPPRVATSGETAVLAQYRGILAQLKSLDEERDLIEARIKELIGDSAGLVCDFGKVTWTGGGESERTDWKAVALALNCPPELIEAHTKVTAKARSLRKTWKD